MHKIDKVFKDLADLYELNRRIRKYRFKENKEDNVKVSERKTKYPDKENVGEPGK
jgi:hypothetical protein